MAFQPPSSKQELQNRKILEELQTKKLLLKQGTTPIATAATVPGVVTPAVVSGAVESHTLLASQRTAIQHAHANSVGYFITQDSSFGNLILPVLPRFDSVPVAPTPVVRL